MPLVIPRRYELGEHVDNHQLQITKKLEELDMVRAFHSLTELETLISDGQRIGADYNFRNSSLLDDLQATVKGWLG